MPTWDVHDDCGATMVEYGLVVALVVLLTIFLVQFLGVSVRGWFEAIAAAFD